MKSLKKFLSMVIVFAMVLSMVPAAYAAGEPAISMGSGAVDISTGAATVQVPVTIANNPGFAGMDLSFSIPDGWSIVDGGIEIETMDYSIFFIANKYGKMSNFVVPTVNTNNNGSGSLVVAYDGANTDVGNNITANGTICWITYSVPAGTVSGDYEIAVTINKINTLTDTATNLKGDFTVTSGKITVTGGVEPTAIATSTLNFAPAVKNVALAAATATKEDAGYTVATEWFKYDEEGKREVAVETGTTAAASTTYTAKMTLTAKHGYAFNNASTVEVNETTTYSVGDGNLALENGKLVLTLSNETEDRALQSIAVKTNPNTTDYYSGDTLNLEGIVLTATYDDRSTEDITSGFTAVGPLTAGQTVVEIRYKDDQENWFTCNITLQEPVIELAVDHLEITPPTTTTYQVGDELNPAGLVVTAVYNKPDTTGVLTEYELSGFDSSAAANGQVITVTDKESGTTAIFTVDINRRTLGVGDFAIGTPVVDYTGSKVGADVSYSGIFTPGTITTLYNGSETIPTEVGTYKVSVTVAESNQYYAVTSAMEIGTYTIEPATITAGLKTEDTKVELVDNGIAKALVQNDLLTITTVKDQTPSVSYAVKSGSESYISVAEGKVTPVAQTGANTAYIVATITALNHNQTTVEIPVTVSEKLPATVSASLDTNSETYDSDGPGFLLSTIVNVAVTDESDDALDDGTLTYTVNGKDWDPTKDYIKDAGDYKIVVYYSDDTHAGHSETLTFTINKAKVDLPKSEAGLIYNGEEKTGVVLPNGAKYTLQKNTGTNAGKYYAEVTLVDKANYEWKLDTPTSDDQTIAWEIQQAPLTFTATAVDKQYDGNETADATVEFDGLANGETLTAGTDYTVSAEFDNANVGNNKTVTVTVTLANTEKAKNYKLTAATDTDTADITKKAITVTVGDIADQTYTGKQIKPEVTITAKDSNDETVTLNPETDYTVTYGENLNAGTNAGTVTVTAKAGSNVTFTEVSKQFDITPASLTVKANDRTITYGEEANNSGVVYTGFVDGESESNLGGTLCYAYNYAGGAVGTYTITPGSLSSNNYVITYLPGVLTVEQKEVGLSWSGYSDLVYDGNAKNVTATATGLVNGDVVAVDVRGGTETNAGENYTATAFALTGEKAGNYKLPETKTKAYTIAPKTLTAANVEVEYASKGYTGNALEPVITVKDGDTVLVKNTDYTVGYANNQYVGTATVTVTMKGNYAGTATKEFEITAVADPAVIDETATVTKGGNTVNLAANVTGAQGTVTYAITDEALALGCTVDGNGVFTAGNTSGTVTVTVTVANKNVDGQGDAEYTGKTATITVTVTDKHTGDLTVTQTGCTYGDTEPLADPTYDTITGVIDSRITYAGTLRKGGTYAETAVKPTEAGDYIVTVQLETNTHIYTGKATFVIDPKSISNAEVTLGAALIYTGNDQTQAVASVVVGETTLDAADYAVSSNTGNAAGDYTLIVTAKDASNYTGTASKSFTVAKKPITPTIVVEGTYTFDGSAKQPTFTVKDGEAVLASGDYAFNVSNNVNAGNGTITVTATNTGNYTFSEAEQTFAIGKAAAQTLADITGKLKYTAEGGVVEIDETIMPTNAGALSFSKKQADAVVEGTATVTDWSVSKDGKVTYTLSMTEASIGAKVTMPVKVTSTNYADSYVNVVITISDKDSPVLTVGNITMTYTGEPVPASKISGSAKFNSASVAGNWSFEGTAPTNANGDGETVVVVFTPTDSANFDVVSTEITVIIEKATPSVEVEYTKINQSNKTLADAELKIKTGSVAGTVAWNDAASTKVEANKAYGWTFTPEDTTNYNTVSGELTPYSVMMYEPVYGSAVQAPAATAEGTVALSTPNAVPGATVVVYPRPAQGYKTAGVTVLDAQGNMVPVTVDANGNYSFKMPNGAVQIIPTFVKDGAATQSQFVDVPAGAWYEDAVNAAVAKGLFGGMTDTTFAPNTEMSRSMLVTVLWRLAGKPDAVVDIDFDDVQDGLWYSDAVAWAAASGVVTGMTETAFGTNGDITREQMAAMLYRYAKLIGLDTTAAADLSAYKDSGKVSSWAQEAMAWCVANGIIGGVTNDTLAPSGDATRAQVATILVRFCEKFGL